MTRVAILDDYQNVARKMADWSALDTDAELQFFQDHIFDEDALGARLKDFEIVLAMRERTPFPKTLLERLPNLKLLITTGMGNASFDLGAATRLGILVCGTSGSLSSTTELTWGLILALMRNIPREDAATRAGKWQVMIGEGLARKNLGILGLGRIGGRMAEIGLAFRMTVLAWSENLTPERAQQCGARLVSKDELLSESDVLTIHVRLSDRTRGLLGARELAMMKPAAFLINTSRGPIVDEPALIDVLRRNAIAGAGLDVFDREPLALDHPLRALENTLISPHMGYVTTGSYRTMFSHAVEDIEAFLAGNPLRVLNESVLEAPNLRSKT